MGKLQASSLTSFWIVKVNYIDGWVGGSFGPFDIEDHDKAMDCVIVLAGRKDVSSAMIETVEQ